MLKWVLSKKKIKITASFYIFRPAYLAWASNPRVAGLSQSLLLAIFINHLCFKCDSYCRLLVRSLHVLVRNPGNGLGNLLPQYN